MGRFIGDLGLLGSLHGRVGVGPWSVWVSLGQFGSVHGFMVSLGRFIFDLSQFDSVHGRFG